MRRLWEQFGPADAPFRASLRGWVLALAAAPGAYALARVVQLASGSWLPFLFGVCASAGSAFTAGLAPGLLSTALTIAMWNTLNGSDGPPRSQLTIAAVVAFGATVLAAWARSMAERNRVQAVAIAQREAVLQCIFDGLPTPILIVTEDGLVASASAAAGGVFHCSPAHLVGKPLADLLGGQACAGPELATETCEPFEARGLDGSRVLVRIAQARAKTSIGELLIVHAHDVAEQVAHAQRVSELQEQVVQASRLTALGELGTAIAHELNQPLTTAVNLLASVRKLGANGTESPSDTLLADAQRELLRAGEILRSLRAFFTRNPIETARVELLDVLREAALLASPWLRERGVELAFSDPPPRVAVLADAVEVQQVILNLLRNSADAVAGSQTRRVTLAAEELGESEILIRVQDTGGGVPAEARERLFQPFNTSKPEGMGVGLAICRTIVEAHGGRIWCEVDGGSERGATFCFSLPRWIENGEGQDDIVVAAADHHC